MTRTPAPRSNVRWDHRVDRLLHSPDDLERRHLYLGKARGTGHPVLLDRRLLDMHAWVHGGTGSRKTSLSFATLAAQLIAGEDRERLAYLRARGLDEGERCSVLVLDLKGDLSLLWNCYLEARQAGVPFKLFTNVVGRPSHAFNPLAPENLAALTTANQRCQTILQALSAEYGPGYGPAFFSAMNEIVLLKYLRRFGTTGSFRELADLLASPELYPGDRADWARAQHLPALAGRLAGVPPLNVTRQTHPDRPGAVEQAIRMPDLLRESQVVYFFLSTAVEKTTVTAVAKLALYMLFCAAASRAADARHRVYVLIDEFQQVISSNVALLLEQARSTRVSLLLAHQNVGQLRADRTGADLADAVESCVGFEQAFKVSGVRELRRVQELSGQKRDVTLSWFQSAADPLSVQSATSEVSVTEVRVPRLGPNEIIDISAAPTESLVRFSEGSGYTQYSGYWVPVVGEFHVSEQEYADRQQAGWPDPGPGAVPVEGDPDPGGAPAKYSPQFRRFLDDHQP